MLAPGPALNCSETGMWLKRVKCCVLVYGVRFTGSREYGGGPTAGAEEAEENLLSAGCSGGAVVYENGGP